MALRLRQARTLEPPRMVFVPGSAGPVRLLARGTDGAFFEPNALRLGMVGRARWRSRPVQKEVATGYKIRRKILMLRLPERRGG
jgi:hypothetical protein